jgi:hypothetical protein
VSARTEDFISMQILKSQTCERGSGNFSNRVSPVLARFTYLGYNLIMASIYVLHLLLLNAPTTFNGDDVDGGLSHGHAHFYGT